MPPPKRKRAPGVPPTNRKRRNPPMSKDEKAAITKEAKKLADELNERIDAELKPKRKSLSISPEERKKRNEQARRRRIAQRRKGQGYKKCMGVNLSGKPCGQATLIPENWDGDEEVTGDYCLWHEPTIGQDQRDSFDLFGTSKKKVYRRVTPGELAHHLISRSPQQFLRPYLKALGLKLNEDGTFEEIGTGLKLHGYSRGGEVRRSPYPDYVGQVNIAEKLLDRVYGKARQAVDLASQNTTVNLSITMDVDRVTKVASVLSQAGALPNGNGNGHAELDDGIIEGTVVDE